MSTQKSSIYAHTLQKVLCKRINLPEEAWYLFLVTFFTGKINKKMKMVVTVVENLKVQPFLTVTDVTKCYRFGETLTIFLKPSLYVLCLIPNRDGSALCVLKRALHRFNGHLKSPTYIPES